MINKQFYRLTVFAFFDLQNEKKRWVCRCDCGEFVIVTTGSLNSGNTKSCGCFKREKQTIHGLWTTRVYSLWQAMLNRCRQDQHKKYYSDKSVCERWISFQNFLNDMGDPPDWGTLDRIDNRLGYFPGNCRWATRTTQQRNTRRRKEYEFNGKSHSLIEWAEIQGVNYEKLRARIRNGWEFSRAITEV